MTFKNINYNCKNKLENVVNARRQNRLDDTNKYSTVSCL